MTTDHKAQKEPGTIANSPRTKVGSEASTSSQYNRHERSITMFERLGTQSSRTTAQSSATTLELCTNAPSPTMLDTVSSFEHCTTAFSHTGEKTPSINFAAILTTIYLAWSIFIQNMQQEPTTWKVKQFCFHAVMITRYIVSNIWKTIYEIIATVILGLLIPPIASFEGLWYLGFILLSINSILYIELTILVSRVLTERCMTPIPTPRMVDRSTAILIKAPIKALPSNYMIVSCYMLSNAYVGWLRKVGFRIRCPWHTFTHIARNGVTLLKQKQLARETHLSHLFCDVTDTMAITLAAILSIVRRSCLRCRIIPLIAHTRHTMAYSHDLGCITAPPWVHKQINYYKMKHNSSNHSMKATASPTILTTEAHSLDEILALVHSPEDIEGANYTLSSNPSEFALDNCATHHVCAQKELFTHIEEPTEAIGVQGVSGRSYAKGIGVISFRIKDDEGKHHDITLNDVIFLPDSRKNLISTSRWGREKDDGCNITSHQTFSVFQWDHNSKRKHIFHKPNCPIPIMTVNDDDAAMVMFMEKHKHRFVDHDGEVTIVDRQCSYTSNLNITPSV